MEPIRTLGEPLPVLDAPPKSGVWADGHDLVATEDEIREGLAAPSDEDRVDGEPVQ